MKAKTVEELSGLRKLIFDLIQTNQGIQNDVSKVVEAVWYRQGWDDNKSLSWNISRVSHAETVTRRLRELHAWGLISYSKEALARREAAYRNEQNTHSTYEQTMAAIVKPKYIEKIVDGERIIIVA